MSGRSDAPGSADDEGIRSLRSTIKFAAGERPLRSVLIVDVDLNDPSGVAERLAASFAAAGDRCVLIDARWSADATDGALGLAELLSGDLLVTSILAGESALVTIGPGRQFNPDALAGESLPCLLTSLSEAGMVLIACKSSPEHADAISIAPRVDATILVVSTGRTRRGRAVEARESLDRVGARLLGVVMVEGKKRWFW